MDIFKTCDQKATALLFLAVLQGILGANVRWHNLDLLPNGRYVMVSNHQSAGDLLCLYQLPHRIIHLVSSSIPKAATAVQNHRLRLWHATPEVYSELAEPSQVEPVHLFPGAFSSFNLFIVTTNSGISMSVKNCQ